MLKLVCRNTKCDGGIWKFAKAAMMFQRCNVHNNAFARVRLRACPQHLQGNFWNLSALRSILMQSERKCYECIIMYHG